MAKPNPFQLFFTKLTHWEYWPFEVVYAPILVLYLWLSIKARSFLFFTTSNPSIETGGLLGESKMKILDTIDPKYKPISIFIPKAQPIKETVQLLQQHQLHYPIILKPDVGERGTHVEKIKNETELTLYFKTVKNDVILQEYIDYPIELGIFYYRFPGANKGTVSSVVAKKFLQITGDGKNTLGTLISEYPRAQLQYERLSKKYDYAIIPKANEVIALEPIGNHCRGTMFIDANYIINDALSNTFDQISQSIPGFYYGRYDLRCKSIEGLRMGKGIKIMELNGAGAEPSHIYDPKHSIFYAWKILFQHWNVLCKISVLNHKNGIPYMSIKEARKFYKTINN